MENQETVTQSSEQPTVQELPKPKRTQLIIGVVVLIVLLAGAAFVGGQLLNRQTQTAGPSGMVVSGGPAGGGKTVSIQLEHAKELPEAAPDVTGLFAERKDNSIFVTMGDKFMVRVDKNGSVDTQTDGNGQKLEVVVTSDTALYKDVTQPPDPSVTDGKIQQKVETGSLAEIGGNSFVTAWGERRGDRLIAKTLVYSQPMMFKAPGAVGP